ncbi:MAG: four-carbon acid sugar kinase family protein, partial [Chloroflexi bacterium]
MAGNTALKLTFYGDDITGSTDAMEALVLAGVPTVLFLEPPGREQVFEKFPGVQAVGLAGMSRTMTPAEMDTALPEAFASLKALGAPITHYKVCSTFDSSPQIGSIGRALEIGKKIFKAHFVPVVVGAPKLRRYVVFGNHFATLQGITYRLDRHPVMRAHPITPMDESDLRLHLAKQTDLKIGLVDVLHLARSNQAVDQLVGQMAAEGVQIVVFDTLDESHLMKVGRFLHHQGQQSQSFVVGSSGVEFALAKYWKSKDQIQPPGKFASPGPV